MIKLSEESNAQSWELEITCKNKEYRNAIIKMLLKYDFINFEVRINSTVENRYLILIWCSWFSNLKDVAEDLNKIEEKFEKS